MTLEDAFDHIADTGATGIEILGEGQIEGYANPSSQFLDRWFGLLDKYKLEPTNMCLWVDMRLTLDRNLTVEEDAAELERDLRLHAFTQRHDHLGNASGCFDGLEGDVRLVSLIRPWFSAG